MTEPAASPEPDLFDVQLDLCVRQLADLIGVWLAHKVQPPIVAAAIELELSKVFYVWTRMLEDTPEPFNWELAVDELVTMLKGHVRSMLQRGRH